MTVQVTDEVMEKAIIAAADAANGGARHDEEIEAAVHAVEPFLIAQARRAALLEAAEFFKDNGGEQWHQDEVVAWLCAGADGAWQVLDGDDDD